MRHTDPSESPAADRCPGRGSWSVRTSATMLALLTIAFLALGIPALAILAGVPSVVMLLYLRRRCLSLPRPAEPRGVWTATHPLRYRVRDVQAGRVHPQYQSALGQWLEVWIDVSNTGYREHVFRADAVELRICRRRYSVDDPSIEVRIGPRLTWSCVLRYDVPHDFTDIQHPAVVTAGRGFAIGPSPKLVTKRRARIVFWPVSALDSVVGLAPWGTLSRLAHVGRDAAMGN